MATSQYQKALENAKRLPDADVWRLVADLIASQTHRKPAGSVTDLFGVLGPVTYDVDNRIRELRDEWDRPDGLIGPR